MSAALLVVDVQNDFCPGGSLAVEKGDTIVPVLNQYLARAADADMQIYASRDWHPQRTSHFAEFGGTWPAHCVRGTHGAEFHPELRLPPRTIIVSKGMGDADEGYSALEAELPDGNSLLQELIRQGVTILYVGGLATDYCVRASVLDALRAGIKTYILLDAMLGVNVHEGDTEAALNEMLTTGALPMNLDEFEPVAGPPRA